MQTEPPASTAARPIATAATLLPRLRLHWERQRDDPHARDSVWVMGSQFSIALLQGLQFFLLARALGPTEFGRIAGVVAITSALLPFSGLGLGNMAIVRISRGQAGADVSLGNALAMTTLSGAIGIALAVAIGAAFLPGPGTWLLMLLLGISDVLLTKYIDVAGHVFYGLDKYRVAVVFYNLHMVARLACAAALWAGLVEPTALAWAQLHLASGLFAAIVVLCATVRLLGRPRMRLGSAAADACTGVFFSLSLAARSVQLDIDKSVLARSASAATAGVYTAAFRLVFMACMPVFAVVLTAQTRMFRRGHAEGLAGTLRSARPLIASAASYCTLLGVAIYLGAPAVPWLLGAAYEGSVEIMRWMCVLPFFMTTHAIASAALSGADAQRPLGGLHAMAAAAALLMNLALVPRFGWGGAVITAYASHALLLVGMLAISMRSLRQPHAAPSSTR